MPSLFSKKEFKMIFKEFIRKNKIKIRDESKDFQSFLKFLEIDFYDWVRENLRSYFREKN